MPNDFSPNDFLPNDFRPRGLLIRAVLAFAAAVSLADRPAAAGFYDSRFDPLTSANPIGGGDFVPAPRPLRPKPTSEKPTSDKPTSDKPANEMREVGKKTEARVDFGPLPKGPLQIVVSIADQHVTLYSNGIRVAQGPVSTGVAGRPTPTGVFSIIQKDRFHHSNLYSNAPMPYMERITWSGVALHEGPLPGYPASHGCIRLSHDFAVRLWAVARLGVRVIVARNEIVPTEFSDPHLFEPKPKSAEPAVAADPAKPADASARKSFAQATIVAPDTVADAGSAPAAGADGLRGSLAGAASAPVSSSPAAASNDPAKPAADPDKSAPAPSKAPPAAEPVRHTGAVAVFISRREKKLYVRQGFEPLFDSPVEIQDPELPFGTHVFTALGLTQDGAHMRWNLMSIAGAQSHSLLQPKIGANAKAQAPVRSAESYPVQTAAQVLGRIQIPQEAIDRIDAILSAGSSLVVADQGLGEETGEGTDFIVLTR